ELANIYANEAGLMLIACQACGQEYHVATSNLTMVRPSPWRQAKNPEPATSQPERTPLAQAIRDCTIHYGDPPNACPETCVAGASMNSEPRRVLQYWQRIKVLNGWQRDPNLEVDVEPARPDGTALVEMAVAGLSGPLDSIGPLVLPIVRWHKPAVEH